MKNLLMLLLAVCMVAPSYGQKRKTYKKRQNSTTQIKKTATNASNAVGGIGCGIELYRANNGTYGYWLSFIQQYAPNVGQARTMNEVLLEVKKEIRLLDEGNIEAGKRFIHHFVKVYGLSTSLNQIFDLWQFTTPEWQWIEKTARDYSKQLGQASSGTLEETIDPNYSH